MAEKHAHTNNPSGAGYSNFKDPVGLLVRMLKSGNKAAYFTLFREGISLLLTPIDWMLAPSERKKLGKGLKSDFPLILILGGSRSGTTLLYQTLSQYLPVSYFNNLGAAFPRSPITGGLMFNKFLRKSKNNFTNYYGSVSGFNGPNDGFHIWNRWFGHDRNHIPDNISPEVLNDLGNFINTWHAYFKKPLLNKNNRNSLCISEFEKATKGNVYYVVIKRDPVYVVQSLIQSRETVQGDKRVGWGLGANESFDPLLVENDPYFYVDEICEQVFAVNNELSDELEQVDPSRYIQVSYEDFCQNPSAIVQEVSQRVFGKYLAENSVKGLDPFKNTNRQKLEDEEFERILQKVSQLNDRTLSLTSDNISHKEDKQ